MVERISLGDESFIQFYAEHILRYKFAAKFCSGKRVLDAGCGNGYGANYIAINGAKSVLGIDISDAALHEASNSFLAPNLRFQKLNVESLSESLGTFDVILNFENIEHVSNPKAVVSGAERILTEDGLFITSTPNGEISTFDKDGKLTNPFHVKEYTRKELGDLLFPHFPRVDFYGEWITPVGKLRRLRARQLYEQVADSYYNPVNRIFRQLKRAMGKKAPPPPGSYAGMDAFDGDFEIATAVHSPYPWPEEIILAVCRKSKTA